MSEYSESKIRKRPPVVRPRRSASQQVRSGHSTQVALAAESANTSRNTSMLSSASRLMVDAFCMQKEYFFEIRKLAVAAAGTTRRRRRACDAASKRVSSGNRRYKLSKNVAAGNAWISRALRPTWRLVFVPCL